MMMMKNRSMDWEGETLKSRVYISSDFSTPLSPNCIIISLPFSLFQNFLWAEQHYWLWSLQLLRWRWLLPHRWREDDCDVLRRFTSSGCEVTLLHKLLWSIRVSFWIWICTRFQGLARLCLNKNAIDIDWDSSEGCVSIGFFCCLKYITQLWIKQKDVVSLWKELTTH